MAIKLFYSFFFLGLNCIVFLLLYRKIGLKLLRIIFILLATTLLWGINYKYSLIANDSFLVLLMFSLAQIVAWYFFKLLYLLIFTQIKNTENGEAAVSDLNYQQRKEFVMLILAPIVMSINQLQILWGFKDIGF